MGIERLHAAAPNSAQRRFEIPRIREILQARGTSSAIDCDVLEKRLNRPASISSGRVALFSLPSARSGFANSARQSRSNMPVTGLKANPQRSPHGRREDIELFDRKEVCEGPLTRTIGGE